MEVAINTLLQRLEQVTARLEAVEGQLQKGGPPAAGGGAAPVAAGAPAAGAAWVAVFDNLVQDHAKPFVAICQKIGGENLKKQAAAFDRAVEAHRNFLNIASVSSKPNQDVLVKLLDETGKNVGEAVQIRDKNRGDAQWNHLSALSEAVPAFGWVTVAPTPGPFVNEYKDSEFYSNKNLVQYKGKDEDQVAFCTHLREFWAGLIAFIKQYHTTGLVWKANGEDAAKFIGGAAPKAAAGGAPAPPPPGPPPILHDVPIKKGADTGALFAAINQGTAISSGLKKVTADQKTKNRPVEDRVAVVKEVPKKQPVTSRGGAVKKGTPKFALDGNKWVVEFQDDNNNIVITDPEPKHTIYLYKNDRSVVQVKGPKVNSICIDSCNKVGIVFNSAIAVVEVVNSSNIEIQCLGFVPAFAIDKCSSIQVILSKEGLKSEIVTSKSDQVNILLPEGFPAGSDLTELAVPEQFKTTIEDRKLVTVCVEHV